MARSTFSQHVVWITGGGSGIGRALALEFAKQGAKVVVSGRRIEPIENAAQAIRDAGGEALAVPCDVTDEPAVFQAVETIVEHFGALHVAVANAGFGAAGPLESIDAATWRKQLDVNVVGAAITMRAALPHLKKTRGRAVLIASVAGILCAPGTGAYNASKFALRAMGLTLAQELTGTGVTCTTIHPGFVESDIARVDNDNNFHEERKEHRPQQLMWTAEDAARVVVRAIAKRKLEYVFTWHGKLGAFLGQHTPKLVHWIMSRNVDMILGRGKNAKR